MFQLSHAPRTVIALDQTTNDLIFTWSARRYDQRKIRTACGKRPTTTPTWFGAGNRLSSLCSRRHFCGFHRGLFRVFTETHIEGALEKAEALARDDRLDQGDGGKQSASSERSESAESSSSWIFGEVKRTIQKYLKQSRAMREPVDRTGGLACAIMPQRRRG